MPAQPQQTPPANPAARWERIINAAEIDFTPLAEASGNLVQFARESRFALDIILNNDSLQRCSTESIIKAVRNIAATGLTLNPAMKLAYLVPRKGQCCLDIGWRGLVKIAVDSGSIQGAKSLIVRANDPFNWRGSFQEPQHGLAFKPRTERGQIIGCYNVALLPSGAHIVELMDMDEINEVRSLSGTGHKGDSPWAKWFEPMCKKSVTRRASKDWPLTERLAAALEMMNEADEIDITPGRNPRAQLDPVAYAAAQVVPDSDERSALVTNLELIASKQGTAKYAAAFEKLSTPQRRLVGRDEHLRLWGLALAADAANAGAQPGTGSS